jgi:hypothetical protein
MRQIGTQWSGTAEVSVKFTVLRLDRVGSEKYHVKRTVSIVGSNIALNLLSSDKLGGR